jgi:hypothetical protein
MDVDWFHRSWPPADPDNAVVEADNIAGVWRRYRSVGARQLVMCGVVSTAADRERYEAAVECCVRMVRLTADAEVTRQRLRGRYSGSQRAALEWHLERCDEIAARLDVANLDELVIDTSALAPDQVAQRVLRHFGLLGSAGPA